jgi:hypothetical protein
MNGDGKKPVRPGEPDPASLLGGWAAGNLSAEEKRRLLEGALEDQRLFDALLTEEALRETLADPATRAQMIDALQPAPSYWRKIFRPWAWVPAAAAAGAMAGFVIWMMQPQAGRESSVELAETKPPRVLTQQEAPPASGAIPVSPIEPSRIKIVPRPSTEEKAQDKPAPVPPPPPALESRLDRREAEEKAGVLAASKAVPAGDQAVGGRARPATPAPKVESAGAVQLEAAANLTEGRTFRATPVSQPAAALEKERDLANVNAADPMPVAVSWRDAAGNWQVLGRDGDVPRGAPVRVSLTAPLAGTVVLQERTRRAAPAVASETVSFELPPFEPGEYDIVVAIVPQGAAVSPGVAFQMTDAASSDRRKVAGAARQERSRTAAAPAEQADSEGAAKKAEAVNVVLPSAPPKSIRIRVK